MNERFDMTPVALYARVSSNRQDVDLSVSAQLRALRDYAEKHSYLVAREYVDEAESGRIADRPQFQKMLDEASKPEAPFKEILVWKFSRFTRKREHAVAFKAMLRRRGVRVVSITEQADDTPTGKLLEAIIESVDEFYSENLAQEVTRGMREAASRGFWVTTYAPYGYRKVYVQDGPKKRPKLELDPPADAVARRIFDMVLQGSSILDVTKALNAEGVASPRGKQWLKTTVHNVLLNEAYTGTLVWGTTAKDGAPPVRVEDAHPAIVSKRQFQRAKKLLGSRAPKKVHPRRSASPYLLSGLLRCETCGKAMTAAEAKSGKYTYYVCHSLLKRGSGTCKTPRLNAKSFEALIIDEIRANVLTESNIRDLVKLLDEEMDGVAHEQRERLQTIDGELEDVKKQLSRVWHFVARSDSVDVAEASDLIVELRERKEKLEVAAEEARGLLSERRRFLDSADTIATFAAEMSDFLKTSELTETRAFVHSFVKEIEVKPGKAAIVYSIPTPDDSPIGGADAVEVALTGRVRSTVQSGGPCEDSNPPIEEGGRCEESSRHRGPRPQRLPALGGRDSCGPPRAWTRWTPGFRGWTPRPDAEDCGASSASATSRAGRTHWTTLCGWWSTCRQGHAAWTKLRQEVAYRVPGAVSVDITAAMSTTPAWTGGFSSHPTVTRLRNSAE